MRAVRSFVRSVRAAATKDIQTAFTGLIAAEAAAERERTVWISRPHTWGQIIVLFSQITSVSSTSWVQDSGLMFFSRCAQRGSYTQSFDNKQYLKCHKQRQKHTMHIGSPFHRSASEPYQSSPSVERLVHTWWRICVKKRVVRSWWPCEIQATTAAELEQTLFTACSRYKIHIYLESSVFPLEVLRWCWSQYILGEIWFAYISTSKSITLRLSCLPILHRRFDAKTAYQKIVQNSSQQL